MQLLAEAGSYVPPEAIEWILTHPGDGSAEPATGEKPGEES